MIVVILASVLFLALLPVAFRFVTRRDDANQAQAPAPASPEMTVPERLERAREFLAVGDRRGAIRVLTSLPKEARMRPETLSVRAAAAGDEESRRLILTFAKSVAQLQFDPEARAHLALTYVLCGDTDEAQRILPGGTGLSPSGLRAREEVSQRLATLNKRSVGTS